MSRPVVFVVEDEDSFVEALEIGLAREGFDVVVARDGQEALDRFAEVCPDLVLLDVMLPRRSGVDVCREIRRHSAVPIIMVTAKSSEIDTVVGLEVGADDYVTKPYRLRELVARMRAVMRRIPPSAGGVAGFDPVAEPGAAPGVIEAGDVMIDVDRHEVRVRGRPLRLPLKEFELLTMLVRHAGRVLTREVLIERIWGMDYVGDTKTLDVHIKRLRTKVEPEPAAPVRIVTVRGLGYKFMADADA